MITAVLFDLDGVLADTLHYHFLAWRDKFAEWGGTVSEHTVLLHEGRNSREILPILMEEAGITIPEDQYHSFIENKREYYRSIVRMTFFPQAFETVAAVRARGFKTALVTASALKNMKTAVPPSQRAHFDFIVTGDEVPRAKPWPDPYLTAARHLGVAPEQCLVVENAPLGIQSAKNAGMLCLAVATTLGRDFLTEADDVIDTIAELPSHPFLRDALSHS